MNPPSSMYVLHCRSTYADEARQFFGSNILFYPRHHFNTKKTVWSSQPIKQDQDEKKGNEPNPREKI